MLRFIESLDRYSVYERTDGTEVYVAHGSGVHLVEYDRDWMLGQWAKQVAVLPWHAKLRHRDEFRDWLRDHVIDADIVDSIEFCEHCEDPDESDSGQSVGRYGDSWACDSCIENNYQTCNDCDYVVSSYKYIEDDPVCDRCEENYSYCDECEEYYSGGNSGDHDHDDEAEDGSCCVSPAVTFTMPNNGEVLSNDDRVTISLPAGHLDDEGVTRIGRYLRDQGQYDASYLVDGLGRELQTSEGNFPKRLSRALYKFNSGKLSPEILSQVGNIGSEHSRAINFEVEITRELNMSAGEFWHEDSCWWGDYAKSRCALKTNGGIGLRTFGGSHGSVQGRAWIMPLRVDSHDNLVPTFDANAADAYVVFNGYGDLEGYNAARIVAHMTGGTYRKIGFGCAPMFVNSDSGYLVGPEEIMRKTSLHLEVEQHSNLYLSEQAREAIPAQRVDRDRSMADA